jgi:hypothetical protein
MPIRTSAEALERLFVIAFAAACASLLLMYLYTAAGASLIAPQALFGLFFLEAALFVALTGFEKAKPESQQKSGALVLGIVNGISLILAFVFRYALPPILERLDNHGVAGNLEIARTLAIGMGLQAAVLGIHAVA